MAGHSFKFRLNWLWHSYQKYQKSGFTLTELLVTILVGSIIITGLLSLVVEMVGKDYKEAARSETQREMQTALEFMSNEMREAAYIYDGDCLASVGTGVGCTGIFNNNTHIPIPNNSVPIIAFWKLDSIPQNCPVSLQQCTNNRLAGRTYTLVVYYLSKNNPNNVWKGKARILRYELAQFNVDNNNNVTATSGYVEPFENNETNPRRWPLKANGSSFPRGSFPTNTVSLTDFVDLPEPGETPPNITCDAGAVKTPNDATLSQHGFAGVRTFYACVRVSATSTGQNQKAILFLKGNAWGKSGITGKEEALATIETQVTNRGVVDKLGEQ